MFDAALICLRVHLPNIYRQYATEQMRIIPERFPSIRVSKVAHVISMQNPRRLIVFDESQFTGRIPLEKLVF